MSISKEVCFTSKEENNLIGFFLHHESCRTIDDHHMEGRSLGHGLGKHVECTGHMTMLAKGKH